MHQWHNLPFILDSSAYDDAAFYIPQEAPEGTPGMPPPQEVGVTNLQGKARTTPAPAVVLAANNRGAVWSYYTRQHSAHDHRSWGRGDGRKQQQQQQCAAPPRADRRLNRQVQPRGRLEAPPQQLIAHY
eukprot:TRINITY_DN1480_c0_g4_i1.p3 TRINITY_DN1480_c0_g4~~TRINITY_DN1480_c0_g4_i1.p3  ORF type:complete len:129 (-),score=21.78 TRINITY_DN1480_c0_g4_i1:488-874(-)